MVFETFDQPFVTLREWSGLPHVTIILNTPLPHGRLLTRRRHRRRHRRGLQEDWHAVASRWYHGIVQCGAHSHDDRSEGRTGFGLPVYRALAHLALAGCPRPLRVESPWIVAREGGLVHLDDSARTPGDCRRGGHHWLSLWSCALHHPLDQIILME